MRHPAMDTMAKRCRNGTRDTMAKISIAIRLGPSVKIDIEGKDCKEIAEALSEFEELNKTVDEMFSDLAKRVFPDVGHTPDGSAAGTSSQ